MKVTNVFLVISSIVCIALNGCSKDNVNLKPNVYVVGYENNKEGVSVAKLWVNGSPHNLTDGIYGSIAYSVFVEGDNVYVAGFEWDEQYRKIAKLWKNGEAQNLTPGTPNTSASFNSVCVSGNDIYVVGEQSGDGKRHVAKLWKNGIAQDLTDGVNSAYPFSVYVSGSDVYVAGLEYNGQNAFAVLWKNGVSQNLTDGTSFAEARSVYVSGSDVYVGGRENNIAVLWKNGVKQNNDETHSSEIHSVFGTGNDVYATGVELTGKYSTILWKNLEKQNLSNASLWAIGYAVYVWDNNVYVAGTGINTENSIHTVAKLWHNGVQQDLTDGTHEAAAYSVFVVK